MNLSGPTTYTKRPRALFGPHYPLGYTASFCGQWLRSRPRRPLLWSLPALVTLLGLVALLLTKQQEPSALIDQYDALARSALKSQDLVPAQLYLEKLVRLDPHNSARMFNLGLVAEKLGQTNRALQIMRRLAPEHKQGYPLAHWWLAKHAALPVLSDAGKQSVRHHLTAVLHPQPSNVALSGRPRTEVLELLARLEAMDNRLPEAAQYLARAFLREPRYGLALARLYVLQGKTEQAQATSASASRAFQRKLASDPSDLSARQQLALLAAFREDFASGEKHLLAGFQTTGMTETQRSRLRVDLGLYRIGWSKFLARSDPNSVDEQLKLLNQALELIPRDPQLFECYARLSAGKPSAAVAVLRAMERLLKNGQESSLAHWVLGTVLGRFKQFESAERHLRLAMAAKPEQAAVYNNLAWVLAHREPPQLPEALQLVQIALNKLPHHPGMRETRGQVYLRMREFEKAAADLEYVWDRVSRKTKVSQSLVIAYTNLGFPEMAVGHQSLVDHGPPESGIERPTTAVALSLFTSLNAEIARDQQGRVVSLELRGPEITDGHMVQLLELPHLSALSLSQTAITDAGLTYLHALKQLQIVDLRDTQLSERGLAYLQESLPVCLILK